LSIGPFGFSIGEGTGQASGVLVFHRRREDVNNHPATQDERTIAVENAGYRFAYLVMSFGLLASVAYRSFVLHQSSWDLLALVVLGGATGTVYRGTRRTLSRRWVVVTLATMAIAALIALAFVFTK
jgi:hypothetical protein